MYVCMYGWKVQGKTDTEQKGEKKQIDVCKKNQTGESCDER